MSGVEKIGTNSGHGHAWERPDGMKMRCGGPRMCKSCGMDAALVANVLAAGKDALSAIEGGGGALQPSASVPTEQADGGVVAALETACRVLRGIPKPRTNDGVSIVYSVSDDVPEDIYTAQSYVEHAMFLLARATPPATPIAGGFGSSSPKSEDTHRVPDGWVLVPKEPTEAMLQGACDKHTPGEPMSEHRGECPRFEARRRIWERMIEASATAPASDTPARYEPEASEPKDAARRDEEAGQ